jgi:glutathione S-transferase
MSMIELYHNNLSVCGQKVRIVLAEKNVPWTSRYVSLVRGEQLTPEFKTSRVPRAPSRGTIFFD